MMKTRAVVLLVACLSCALAPFGQAAGTQATTSPERPAIFDPSRDAAKDLEAGISEAARTGRRVLVDVGGNWCGWCREMERFVESHPELKALRDRNYVTVKINFSPENENVALLSKYPKISGYPHLFVLERDGTLLHSQNTSLLEDGKSSYVLEKFKAFLTQWAPAAR